MLSSASSEELRKNIKAEQEKRGMTDVELSRLSGVTVSKIRFWLKDGERRKTNVPAWDTVEAIAAALDVKPHISIPFLGGIPAGAPIHIEGSTLEMAERIALPQVKPHHFALQVEGDSMNLVAPEGYVLIVSPKYDPATLNGRMVVANFNGESTFKRYRAHPLPMLEPRSTNPAHSVIVPNGEDELKIIGVVDFVVGDWRGG